MATEKEPSDDQTLRERVAALEQQIDSEQTNHDSTHTRRSLLASAAAVAGLGASGVVLTSRPASAQASGGVGTSAEPLDVEGYDVTAQNSFTDPAGVTHTGELADIGDVSGAGQWQEVNSGSNIEPTDGETIGTGSESINVGSVSADSHNNVVDAAPGEVQAILDDAGNISGVGIGHGNDSALVELEPNETYDPGSELNVPGGVTLDMNGATISPSADHNLVFLDNDSHLKNGRFDVDPDIWTSNAVVLDPSRATEGKYSVGPTSGTSAGSHATAELEVLGDPSATISSESDGTGLYLNAQGSAITVGCALDVRVFRVGRGIHADGDTYVNLDNVTIDITSCYKHIHQTGSVRFDTHMQGVMQPAGPTNNLIHNETGSGSVFVEAQLWDKSNCAGTPFVGENIAISSKLAGAPPGQSDITTWFDGSPGQLLYTLGALGEFVAASGATGDVYKIDPRFGWWTLYINGDEWGRLENGNNGQGSFKPVDNNGNRLLLSAFNNRWKFRDTIDTRGGVRMISSPPSPTSSNTAYIDDGTNTGDGSPGIRYTTDAGSTWNDMN